MNTFLTPIQMRELFHLEFLRWFGGKPGGDRAILKGGVNLKFFFQSIRYSEDMDIDVWGPTVARIRKSVMETLSARGFTDSLKSFGIEKIVPPDMTKAKQTETTQRFKIHLLTSSGEDLFTKIEFSRRGLKGTAVVESVPARILRSYKMAPLLVRHYDAVSAVAQKIQALAQRAVLQARDVFDLFILSSQCAAAQCRSPDPGKAALKAAHERIFQVDFAQFRDTVVAYLGAENQKTYGSSAIWDEIKLKTAHFLEEIKNANG